MKENFLGLLDPHNFGRDPSEIFSFNAKNNLVRDYISGTDWTQTYAGTNRTRINSAGLLEAVGANTPVIDHVGASLEPALRLEPAAANLLFGTRTFTAAAGWDLFDSTSVKDAVGVDGVANSATTLTDTSAGVLGMIRRVLSKSASDSTTYFLSTIHIAKTSGATTFPGTGVIFYGVAVKTAYFTVNTNTGVLTAYSANDAANIGSEIKSAGLFWRVSVWAQDNGANATFNHRVYSSVNTDASGTWSNTPQGSCVIDAAMLTTGSIPSSYFAGAAAIGAELIAAQVDRDFSGASAWANVDLNAYDETTDLTITANAAGQYCTLPEANAPMTVGKVYRITFALANIVGSWTVGDFDGNVIGTAAANGTYYFYWICTATGGGLRLTAVTATSSGDFDNFSVKEHGTVRLSEANTTTLAIPADVAAALASTGTIVIKDRFAFARAAGVVTNILASAAATNSLIYTTTAAGNITSNDGTTIAENTGAYTANTDWKIALKFPSDTDKYRIGIDVAGAGIAWGTEVAFDGAFTATANLILGYVLHGATWIKYIKIFDKVLTDAQIDAMS